MILFQTTFNPSWPQEVAGRGERGKQGGARPGAGRKKGGKNKLTQAQLERAELIAAAAAAKGKLPHQILFELGKGERVPRASASSIGRSASTASRRRRSSTRRRCSAPW
jgi:hypothetical protein